MLGGHEWHLLVQVSEQEKALIASSLVRLDKEIAKAVAWVRKQPGGLADRVLGATIEFVYDVPGEKTEDGRTFYSAGMSGKYPDLKHWRVEIAPTLTLIIQRLVDLGDDRSFWQQIAWTQLDTRPC